MREPTVWAVTDPQGRVLKVAVSRLVPGAMGLGEFDVGPFDALSNVPLPLAVRDTLAHMILDSDRYGTTNPSEPKPYEHAGYRIAPRALVTPEALAVVRDAVAYIDTPDDDPMGYGDDARHAALAASVRHLVDSAAYRAATARDAKGGDHG